MGGTVTVNGVIGPAVAGLSLFEHADRLGVRVPTSCRTQGKCRECIVEVVDGAHALSPPTTHERHLAGSFRLSCQSCVSAADAHIRCHTMRRGRMRIERHAVGLDPDRLACRGDPAVTRRGDRILLDGETVARSGGPIHGLAVDLGTTTIVLRLFDLDSGEMIADTSFENPQRFGGSDVMARIQYDGDHPGRLLLRALAGYLTHAIEELPVDPATIYEAVVVGNSTMRDLFFRKSVQTIGQSPYRSITEIELEAGRRTTTSLAEPGRRSLLPIHPNARVYGGPIISGHVGADAAAAMLAVGLGRDDRLSAIMDIGTNTELVLGDRDRILAASCPAGPAFEGGGVACGMPALDGAIDTVAATGDGRLTFGVIGGGPPQGICGSGLVELTSELLRTARMNALGRFERDGDRITLDADHDVFLTERDVNELAQAKGANAAGLQVVFERYGAAFDDLDRFYLAGGFGRRLNAEAAASIGLIPTLAPSRVVQVGNAAIEGASLALLSRTERQHLETIVRRVEHCRLETHPHFFEYFVEGCQFKPLGPDWRWRP